MGGCAIAVARAGDVTGVLDRLRTRFYDPRAPRGPLEDHLFLAEPAGGARVVSVG
jgi:hypothetical protein